MKALVSLALILTLPTFATAATDTQKCQAKKNQIAGKYSFCRQKAFAKSEKKGTAPDFTKCVATFDKLWGKAETKWGTLCQTLGDGPEIKQRVENCTLATASILDCTNVAGACWFLGAPGDSCDDACADVGLVVDPDTSAFAGASDANCNAVLDALGDPNPDYVGPVLGCFIAVGCHVADGDTRLLCVGADDAGLGNAERVCACE